MASTWPGTDDGHRPSSRRLPPRIPSEEDDSQGLPVTGNRVEGYDYDIFVPRADDKFTCPICIMVLREPIQTSCGHRFCDACIKRWIREKDICPVCTDRFVPGQMFPDNYAKREVMAMRVKCANHKAGCTHQGELLHLQEHLTTHCPYEFVVCPHVCGRKLRRHDVNRHTTKECPRRPVKCEYCGRADVYYVEMKRHEAECPEMAETCELCGDVFVRRLTKKHRSLCSKEKVKCLYSVYGCCHEFPRESKEDHETKYVALHLRLVMASSQSTGAPLPIGLVSTTSALSRSGPILSLSSQQRETGFVSGGSNLQPPTAGSSNEPMVHSIRMDDSTDLVFSATAIDRPVKGMVSVFADSGAASFDVDSPDGKKASTDPISDRRSHLLKDKEIQEQRKKISHLTGLVQNHEKLISDQQQLLQRHETTISRLEHHLREHDARLSNGLYVWKIKEFRRRKGEAVAGKTIVHHSPGFYTSFHGYKMCIRINLNGVDSGSGRQMALFIHLMQGDYDDILKWPFQGKITLSILDQKDIVEQRKDITETLIAKPELAAFLRPTSKRNHKGFGYIEFAPINFIESGSFIKNDTLIVKAIVEPSKELLLGNH